MHDFKKMLHEITGKQYVFLKCGGVQILGTNARKSKLSP
jgi:hypothetical protein